MVPPAHGLRYSATIGGIPSISTRAERSFVGKKRSLRSGWVGRVRPMSSEYRQPWARDIMLRRKSTDYAMSFKTTLIWLFCLLGAIVSRVEAGAVSHLDLGGAWQLHQDDSPAVIPAKVPGCVHLDLLAAARIADPFYRDNQ